jgi:triphosphoribosyl-dephospho-CoA synthase
MNGMGGREARLGDAQAAFLWACRLDVAVRKPGNVSVASPGHGMTAGQFVASAAAAAPHLFDRGASVGQRIEAAVRASLAAAGCNTNLGIVLLLAPLAHALEQCERAELARWRAALTHSLERLDLADARCAFRAIARANPGGLGRVERHDVGEPATIDLRAAMAFAASRDRIAKQYTTDFTEIFDLGLAAFEDEVSQADVAAPCCSTPAGGGTGAARPWRCAIPAATLATFLAFLRSAPDSHIVRRHGMGVAQGVTEQAVRFGKSIGADATRIAAWDEQLKARGINPGTSADLTVATAFIAAILDPALRHAFDAPVA